MVNLLQSSLTSTHSFSTGAYLLSAYLDSCFDSSANLRIFPLFVDSDVPETDEMYASVHNSSVKAL